MIEITEKGEMQVAGGMKKMSRDELSSVGSCPDRLDSPDSRRPWRLGAQNESVRRNALLSLILSLNLSTTSPGLKQEIWVHRPAEIHRTLSSSAAYHVPA